MGYCDFMISAWKISTDRAKQLLLVYLEDICLNSLNEKNQSDLSHFRVLKLEPRSAPYTIFSACVVVQLKQQGKEKKKPDSSLNLS
jgi:hypothetical protein